MVQLRRLPGMGLPRVIDTATLDAFPDNLRKPLQDAFAAIDQNLRETLNRIQDPVDHTHTPADIVPPGTFAVGLISEASVVQHEGALTIGASQVQPGTFDGNFAFDDLLNLNGPLEINVAGQDLTLLRFDTERSWRFVQRSTGASASLALQTETSDKTFTIENSDGTELASFRTEGASAPLVNMMSLLQLRAAQGSNEHLRLNHTAATGSPYVSWYQAGTRRAFAQWVNGVGLRVHAEPIGHEIQLWTGGAGRAWIKDGLVEVGQPLLVSDSGSAAAPAIRINDADTGFYRTSTAIRFAFNAGLIGEAEQTGRWRAGGGVGDPATPSWSFIGDEDTGMYRAGADLLGFAAGGESLFQIRAASNQVLGPDGTVSQPGYSFIDASGQASGMYRDDLTGALGFSEGGVSVLELLDGSAFFFSGSALSPSISFDGDGDTGIYRAAADSLGITTGGSQRIAISGTNFHISVPAQLQAATTWSNSQSWVAGRDSLYLGQSSGGTQGAGNFGPSIAFSQINGGGTTRRAAIVLRQNGSDPDNCGLSIWTHPSSTAADPMVECLRIGASGSLNVESFGDVIANV